VFCVEELSSVCAAEIAMTTSPSAKRTLPVQQSCSKESSRCCIQDWTGSAPGSGNAKRGISPEMAVRLAKVFGGTEQGWLIQQAQYDLAQVRRDRIKLKRLKVA